MKTKNVFELTHNSVTMIILDVSNIKQGEDASKAPELQRHVFDVTEVPETLQDGDNAMKSLAAYGLSRLLQDRNSSVTDGSLADLGLDAKGAASARMDAYKDTYEVLKSGEFRARRASAPKGAAVDTFFAQGLVDFLAEQDKEMDINTATAYLQQRSNEERKALRTKLDTYIKDARKRAQEAANALDLGDLLG